MKTNQSDHYLSSSEIHFPFAEKNFARKEVIEMQEDLRSLYDHSDYGEAFDGMAKHVSDMSMLERQIFEDCDLVDGKVCAPHQNHTPFPFWMSTDYIAKKCNCTFREARDLLDCWMMLDPTHEMVETFIRWTKVRGVDKALSYFQKLALALAEVENIDPEDVTENPEPEYHAPDEYAYHVIGEYPEDEEPEWLDAQPVWFKNLIAKVKAIKDLETLSELGKAAYQMDMTKDQSGVFWTEYNIQKSKLESEIQRNLSTTARVFIQKIRKANGNLKSLGVYLYKIQHGDIKVQNPPTQYEWKIIWNEYRKASSLEGLPARKEVNTHV